MKLRVRGVLRGRLPRPSDDSGNIAMLLMVILVGATIGALLLTMIINQNSSTRFTGSRVRSLDAAQAGIDAMLGQIRGATTTGSDGKTFGNSDSLPCATSAAPLSGSANASGTMTYNVSVVYYMTDPAKGGTAMTCAANYGPYDAATGSHTPRYAVITSSGVDSSNANSASKGRTLTTTYVFQTDDVNIPGGEIQLYSSGSAKWCMDAGSGTPASGAAVLLESCSTSLPPAARQVFAYRSDLSIQLVSSVTTSYPAGLCLDTSPTAHAAGRAIVLQPCYAVGSSPWNQQWSVNSFAHLEGAKTDQSDTDNTCISAASQTADTALLLQSCNTNKYSSEVLDPEQTWIPSATTGDGSAGGANGNIVNYRDFANCVDVAGKDPATPYLQLYTCKTNPSPANLDWNQLFAPGLGAAGSSGLPRTGTLTTKPNGVNYCMQDPTAAPWYVTVSRACTSTWTYYQTKDSAGKPLSYARVYTIVDSLGKCLSSGPANDLRNNLYLKVIVTACDGGTEQKWNADPSVLASRLTNSGEK
ncbi:ricin-type beta-trefoil lectin domain protein [uncultured Jatrophihabitans sp.]|uniref:ricin-type beta-trefoil lectin domain protein n=1 Tax=uncultured Jatrophihabitans sp. TaxID=1610747 RepID=UPI0035CB7333